MAKTWASEYGSDPYGSWAAVAVGEIPMVFRHVEPGSFWMGSPVVETGRRHDEGPRHRVTLTHAFWLADVPCTQSLWTEVMDENPSSFRGLDQPVEQVSWQDTQAFLARLNERLPALEARLPTEAEWEYACRAGTTGSVYKKPLSDIAWYGANSGQQTQPVRGKEPNAWGLYDTLGNVWEWCQDAYGPYSLSHEHDPVRRRELDTSEGVSRSLRGGAWSFSPRMVRAASRRGYNSAFKSRHFGFRIARG